jgi:4-hydroxybenzoate polyprenyltransferase
MIILIQILFKYVYFKEFSVDTALNNFDFLLLILATSTIAAAGYIINDIFDVKSDLINKPKKVLIGKSIRKDRALTYYYILNVFGISFGFLVAYKIHNLSFISIFIIIALLLRVYNSNLKKLPVVGNLIISLLVSLSILIIGIFDIIPAVNEKNTVDQYYAFKTLTDYATFAFMLMLLREIVKDIEDIVGDKKLNMSTLPILIGKNKTNKIIFFLSFIPLILITDYSFRNFSNVPIVLVYMLLVVLLPFLYFMTKILYAKTNKDYSFLSTLLKLIMLLGIFSIVIISLTINYA